MEGSVTNFAKLFESEKFGQILVTRENDDQGDPAVTLAIYPGSPLDVCRAYISFRQKGDDEDGHFDKRDAFFEGFDAEQADKAVARMIWPTVEPFLAIGEQE